MRKMVCVLLCVCLLVTVSSCGSRAQKETPDSKSTGQASEKTEKDSKSKKSGKSAEDKTAVQDEKKEETKPGQPTEGSGSGSQKAPAAKKTSSAKKSSGKKSKTTSTKKTSSKKKNTSSSGKNKGNSSSGSSPSVPSLTPPALPQVPPAPEPGDNQTPVDTRHNLLSRVQAVWGIITAYQDNRSPALHEYLFTVTDAWHRLSEEEQSNLIGTLYSESLKTEQAMGESGQLLQITVQVTDGATAGGADASGKVWLSWRPSFANLLNRLSDYSEIILKVADNRLPSLRQYTFEVVKGWYFISAEEQQEIINAAYRECHKTELAEGFSGENMKVVFLDFTGTMVAEISESEKGTVFDPPTWDNLLKRIQKRYGLVSRYEYEIQPAQHPYKFYVTDEWFEKSYFQQKQILNAIYYETLYTESITMLEIHKITCFVYDEHGQSLAFIDAAGAKFIDKEPEEPEVSTDALLADIQQETDVILGVDRSDRTRYIINVNDLWELLDDIEQSDTARMIYQKCRAFEDGLGNAGSSIELQFWNEAGTAFATYGENGWHPEGSETYDFAPFALPETAAEEQPETEPESNDRSTTPEVPQPSELPEQPVQETVTEEKTESPAPAEPEPPVAQPEPETEPVPEISEPEPPAEPEPTESAPAE